MKVAVSAQAVRLDAAVDPRFGRAPLFVLIDTDSGVLTAIENGADASAQGAGVQAAAAISRAGAAVVLTGHCGPKAFAALSAAGIRVFTGAEGTVAGALARYRAGELVEARTADVGGHGA
jgi:predicted Fe-Mo cluster-binding NifX family protein